MNSSSRRRALLLLLLGVIAAGGIGLAIGAELGRRWPWHAAERYLERYSISLRSIEPWEFRARSPITRYEPMVAVVDGRALVMGGFHTNDRQANARVDEYDPVANRWGRRGDMPEVITHGNAVIRDGEIWIVGGFTGNHPGPATTSTWRYAPSSDSWQQGPPLPAPRGGGGTALAPDGSLHHFGGWLPDRYTDSPDHWRLPPGGDEWEPAAPMPDPRGHFGVVTLGGFIYAIGGNYAHDPWPIDADLVHRYDPRSDTWEEVAPLPEPLSHTEPSTFVHEGRIIVAGGRSIPKGKPSPSAILAYDPAYDHWSYMADMPRGLKAPVAVALGDELFVSVGAEDGAYPVNLQSWSTSLRPGWARAAAMPEPLGEVAAALIGDRIYVVGRGREATLAFDPGIGEWDDPWGIPPRPIPGDHHAAETWEGELYLLGGFSRGSLDAVQIYNPETRRWRLGAPVPFPAGSAATAVIGGQIYLAGGIVGDTTTRQAARLDLATGTWHPIAPMLRARNHAAAATDGSRLYVFGGRGPGSGDANVVANGFDDVQIYDPATDSWMASGDGPGAPVPLPQARGGMGKAVFTGGEFWVMGGETQDGAGATAAGVYDRVDIYDPLANRWRAGPALPTARHGIFPVVRGRNIWVFGGGTRAGFSASPVAEFLTLPAPTE